MFHFNTPSQAVRGEIEFRGVRFAYPSRPSVVIFSNFNLTVAAGQVAALVGESGSGGPRADSKQTLQYV